MPNQPTVSTDSNAPFVDEDKPFKMKWSTLKTIIGLVIAGVAGGVAWAVNIKTTMTQQTERSERIEVRIKSVEDIVGKQTEAMFEQKMNLRLMDQKLDSIARTQQAK